MEDFSLSLRFEKETNIQEHPAVLIDNFDAKTNCDFTNSFLYKSTKKRAAAKSVKNNSFFGQGEKV